MDLDPVCNCFGSQSLIGLSARWNSGMIVVFIRFPSWRVDWTGVIQYRAWECSDVPGLRCGGILSPNVLLSVGKWWFVSECGNGTGLGTMTVHTCHELPQTLQVTSTPVINSPWVSTYVQCMSQGTYRILWICRIAFCESPQYISIKPPPWSQLNTWEYGFGL